MTKKDKEEPITFSLDLDDRQKEILNLIHLAYKLEEKYEPADSYIDKIEETRRAIVLEYDIPKGEKQK